MTTQTRIGRPMQALGVAETGIGRVMVIGAGSMGSGLAAQFANAGVPVDLLDTPGIPRNAAAEGGIARQLKAGGFMSPEAAQLIRTGNVEDDLGRVAEADWIVEVVIEDLATKRDLFARIEAHRRPGTLVTSNTSTLRLADMTAKMSPAFTRDFAITHFFNPPRFMPLVELLGGHATSTETLARVRQGLETILGKTVIDCLDTPGFIANRIGCYWIAMGILEAKRIGLTVEQAEAVNIAFGVPRSGVFGCLDIIGIDLVPNVWGSLNRTLLATDDLLRFNLTTDPLITGMIANGKFGRKAKAGFSRRATDGSFDTIGLETGEYRAAIVAELPDGGKYPGKLIGDEGLIGSYARSLLANIVAYACEVGPEIAHDIGAVDLAMQLGYGWKDGPFALADRIGLGLLAGWLARESRPVPALLSRAQAVGGFYNAAKQPLYTGCPERVVTPLIQPSPIGLAREKGARLWGNALAEVWDLGDGVACFEAKSKMNCFDPAVFEALEMTLLRGPGTIRALVLGNGHPRAFSVGADLSFISRMIAEGQLTELDQYIEWGQRLFLAMKRAPFPVVAAAHGFALGGGCEFTLHADAVVAHCELNMALPEVKVGLVPAWGGCAQLLLRSQELASGPKGPGATAKLVFNTIIAGEFSTSSADAKAKGYLNPAAPIVMKRTALVGSAQSIAASLADGYTPPEPALLQVAGPSGKAGLMVDIHACADAGGLTETDVALAETLAEVLTGGPSGDPGRPATEEDIMALERGALIELVKRPTTRARIDHMMATGKPLRN
jgi:3-hydroxyacyl-CoA dehydrogenase